MISNSSGLRNLKNSTVISCAEKGLACNQVCCHKYDCVTSEVILKKKKKDISHILCFQWQKKKIKKEKKEEEWAHIMVLAY